MKKVYYAHSLHLYNTPQEERDVILLEALGYEVVNPNTFEMQDKYTAWTKEVPDTERMKFFEWAVGKCDVIAFRRHVDMTIPSGVMYELDYAFMRGIHAFELPTILPSQKLTVDETREYLRYNGQR